MKNCYDHFYIGYGSNNLVVLQWSRLHMQLNRFSLVILNACVDRRDLLEFNIKTSVSGDPFMHPLLTLSGDGTPVIKYLWSDSVLSGLDAAV